MLQKFPDINLQKMIPTKKVQYDEIIPHLPQMGKSKSFFFVCVCWGAEISSAVSEHIFEIALFSYFDAHCAGIWAFAPLNFQHI